MFIYQQQCLKKIREEETLNIDILSFPCDVGEHMLEF